MGRLWPKYPELAPADLLVPVPLSPRRLRERGYNQALLLAQEASKWCGVACGESLMRLRNTKPQWKLGKDQRRKNVAAAFGLKPAANVEGLNVVLVDDVCTTGSSLEACAKILMDAKAKSVSAYVLARESLL
jgi:ComF family protein